MLRGPLAGFPAVPASTTLATWHTLQWMLPAISNRKQGYTVPTALAQFNWVYITAFRTTVGRSVVIIKQCRHVHLPPATPLCTC